MTIHIDVEEFNEILADGREEAEAENWAFILLDDDWLKQHRVH
ncbi:hypothetical protein [Streptomyces colonosanans]|nr:hypothetical protein [Streptomyces colonosanans]